VVAGVLTMEHVVVPVVVHAVVSAVQRVVVVGVDLGMDVAAAMQRGVGLTTDRSAVELARRPTDLHTNQARVETLMNEGVGAHRQAWEHGRAFHGPSVTIVGRQHISRGIVPVLPKHIRGACLSSA
jgi:Arc/MetJ family transcription regulator